MNHISFSEMQKMFKRREDVPGTFYIEYACYCGKQKYVFAKGPAGGAGLAWDLYHESSPTWFEDGINLPDLCIPGTCPCGRNSWKRGNVLYMEGSHQYVVEEAGHQGRWDVQAHRDFLAVHDRRALQMLEREGGWA